MCVAKARRRDELDIHGAARSRRAVIEMRLGRARETGLQLAKVFDEEHDAKRALLAWRAVKRVELLRGYVGETADHSSARLRDLTPAL